MHVGEQRVAAGCRKLLRVQHRAQARPLLVRQVGVPIVARIAQADRLAALVPDVGDDQNLGLARQQKLMQHMDLRRPEAAAECDLLRRRDALVAEHDHVVVEVGALDSREVVARDLFDRANRDDRGDDQARRPFDIALADDRLFNDLLDLTRPNARRRFLSPSASRANPAPFAARTGWPTFDGRCAARRAGLGRVRLRRARVEGAASRRVTSHLAHKSDRTCRRHRNAFFARRASRRSRRRSSAA